MESSSRDYNQRLARERFMKSDDLTLEELRRLDLTEPEVAAEFLRRYSGGRRAPGDRDQRTLQAPGHQANMADVPGFDHDYRADLED